jgi:hypothetical protein
LYFQCCQTRFRIRVTHNPEQNEAVNNLNSLHVSLFLKEVALNNINRLHRFFAVLSAKQQGWPEFVEFDLSLL